jgi:hypothetical protein
MLRPSRSALRVLASAATSAPREERRGRVVMRAAGKSGLRRRDYQVLLVIGSPADRATGARFREKSGISVMDIDGPRHPEAEAWFAAHRAQLPATRIHRTRSGGLHLLFQHARGVRNTQSRLAVGVDTREEGGFVIWWPAVGCPVISDATPAPWPQWLLEALLQPAVSRSPLIHDREGLLPPTVRESILQPPLERAVARAPEGRRNGVLFWAACRVGEVIAAGQINSEFAAELLARAAVLAGLPEAEARRTPSRAFAAWAGVMTTSRDLRCSEAVARGDGTWSWTCAEAAETSAPLLETNGQGCPPRYRNSRAANWIEADRLSGPRRTERAVGELTFGAGSRPPRQTGEARWQLCSRRSSSGAIACSPNPYSVALLALVQPTHPGDFDRVAP